MDVGPSSVRGLLLVEDDRDVREAISEVLEQEGYAVSAARTGADAIEKLEHASEMPVAILLDLMMPVMDGWEFWTVLQRNTAWAKIPVVILSADTNVGEKAKLLRAEAYLRKPIDIDELLALLMRLANRQVRREASATE